MAACGNRQPLREDAQALAPQRGGKLLILSLLKNQKYVQRQPLLLDFNVFGMKNGQTRYLLKVVLFIERQDFGDTVIFHNDAVNHVPHS